MGAAFSMKKGLIVMVNYNQSVEIGDVLDRVEKCMGKEHVVVVDDGSTDNSDKIAEEEGFKVLRHFKNLGLGASIRTGIHYAMETGIYGFVVIMSTNGKMRPEEIPIIVKPILQGECDYVQGSRFLEGGSAQGISTFRRFTIPVFSFLTSLILGRKFSDISCGFRAYALDFLKDSKIDLNQEWLNRYEMEYYIHYWACRLKIKIKEVPIHCDYFHLKSDRKTKIQPFVGWWSMIRPFVYLPLGVKK